MTPRRFPWVFRIAAAVLLTCMIVGQVWQRRPAGRIGGAMLSIIAANCPAAVVNRQRPTIADSARALDRWGFARLASLVRHDGRARCRRQR